MNSYANDLLCLPVAALNVITAPPVKSMHQGFPMAHEYNHNSVSLLNSGKLLKKQLVSVDPERQASAQFTADKQGPLFLSM